MIKDRTFLIWTVLPMVPLMVAFVILDIVHGDRTNLMGEALALNLPSGPSAEIRFLNALVVYLSVGIFHLAACLTVIVLMTERIAALSRLVRWRAWIVVGALVALLVLTNAIVRVDDVPGALNLTYRNTCSVVRQAEVAVHLMPASCTGGGLSTFAWLAVLPYGLGLLAAVFAAAVASASAAPFAARFGSGPEPDIAELRERVESVDRAFQVTTFVLVTSTISLMLFYQLPLALAQDDAVRALLAGYEQSMTMFWGMIFTLTLMAIFGPAALLLRRARETLRHGESSQGARLEKTDFLTTRKQISNLLAVLAPLLVGSSGTIVDMIAGSL